MSTLINDVKFALRQLRKSPGFTVIVIVILAVGIGANTAIFSVVNAVMLRPLPYKDSHRLVIIQEQDIPWMEGFGYRPNFFWLREHNDVFESLAGYCGRMSYMTGIEKPHEVKSADVTWNLFSLLGIRPLLGRGFLPKDEKPQSTRVIVLSHAFWKDYFGGSPDVIGKSMGLTRGRLKSDGTSVLNSESYTIVGVMPAGFDFPFGRSVSFWTPIVLAKESADLYPLPIICRARLKPGVTLKQASTELTLLAGRLPKTGSSAQAGGGTVRVRRLLDIIVEGHRKLLLLLLGAAGFVLLIACSNVANLFLARAAVRQREMAMRLALGASRGRVLRQMLTESLLLSLGAGILGLALTCCTIKGLVHLCPSDIPRLHETGVDLSVLGFTLGASVLTGLLFGMMPAWRASDICVVETLKSGSERTTSGRGWRRLHSALVISQLGLSLVLLFGAALLIRSLIALESMDLGFRLEHMLAVNIELPEAKYSDNELCTTFFEMLLERLRTLPHVRSAAVLYNTDSLTDEGMEINFSVPGRTNPEEEHSARPMSVSPNFFKTMGIKFLGGQTFTDQGPDGFIIDKTLANKYFSGIDPVGRHLVLGDKSQAPIIGVVDTMRNFQTPEPAKGVIYFHGNCSVGFGIFLIRTDGNPMRLAPVIRMQVADLEKDQVIKTIEPLEVTLSQMLTPRRFVMILLGLFAGIALILAMIGVYGLLQYSSTQQIHDIGIRMALGARNIDILRAVLGQGLKLIFVGVLLGLAGAVVFSRILSSLLYNVTPTDPLTLAFVSFALAVIALLASYIPARRAAKVDPMEALRYE
jgi:putative ABC transport system permease protein